MTYKEAITAEMTKLGQNSLCRFVGYGMKKNGAMGTLSGVRQEQIVEMPVAENLMTGVATGLALYGFLPVVYFERADFLLNAADAIVNHTDKVQLLSLKQFSAPVIFRVTIGNTKKPLFTGPTHVQDFSRAFRSMLSMRVSVCEDADHVADVYGIAYEELKSGKGSMIFELKDKM